MAHCTNEYAKEKEKNSNMSRVITRDYGNYCKSGNFHVEIIHAVNIHVDLFSCIYGTHESILT